MQRKVKKVNLSAQLVEAITEQIESGALKAGDKLPNEIELAASFEVSRNIMREAMKVLENFGILESKAGSGTFISENAIANVHSMHFFDRIKTNTSVRKILEARLIIEPNLAYYACQRAAEEEIQCLERITAETVENWKNGKDPTEDFAFHLQVAKMSRNDLLENFLHVILAQLKDSDYMQVNQYASAHEVDAKIKDHIEIVDAMRKHDAQKAKEIMYTHLLERVHTIDTAFNIDLTS